MATDTHKTTKMTSAGNKADVIQVVVTKPYDGIREGEKKEVRKDFPYLGYMVKEGYWKKID